jgi:hypothetical protein
MCIRPLFPLRTKPASTRPSVFHPPTPDPLAHPAREPLTGRLRSCRVSRARRVPASVMCAGSLRRTEACSRCPFSRQ